MDTAKEVEEVRCDMATKFNTGIANYHRIRSPCKDCTKRQVGCHTVCRRYKIFRGLLDISREKHLEKLDEFEFLIAVRSKTKKIALRNERNKRIRKH